VGVGSGKKGKGEVALKHSRVSSRRNVALKTHVEKISSWTLMMEPEICETVGFSSTLMWLIAKEDLGAIIRRGSSNLQFVLCVIKRRGIKTYEGVEVAPCIHKFGIRWRRVSVSRPCHFSIYMKESTISIG
jgi:hypothetical protein